MYKFKNYFNFKFEFYIVKDSFFESDFIYIEKKFNAQNKQIIKLLPDT